MQAIDLYAVDAAGVFGMQPRMVKHHTRITNILALSSQLSQPELATLVALTSQDELIAIEVALPAAEKDAFELLLALFQESFSLAS